MSGTVTNVKVWDEIEVYSAPLGTTPPTDPSATPSVSWEPWGFLDPAGLKQTLDENSDTLKSYEGIPVHVTSEFNGSTFVFTAIEDNDVVQTQIYEGSDAPTVSNGVRTFVAKVPKRAVKAWLLHFHSGNDHAMQIVKKGQISGVSLADKTRKDLGGAEITVTRVATDSGELFTEISTADDDSSSS